MAIVAQKADCVAILLAGGSGTRMQGATPDKVLLTLAKKPVIQYSIEAFLAEPQVAEIVFVCRDAAQRKSIETLIPDTTTTITWAQGGKERQDSVHAGLEAASTHPSVALIHDCARPLITTTAITDSIAAVRQGTAACLANPVVDTIKEAAETDSGFQLRTLDRSRLWAMSTPQSFDYATIRNAYARVIASGQRITDDLSAIEASSLPVKFIDNKQPNPKLTIASDIDYLEFLLTRIQSK